jgi:hypothetical protein
MITKLITAAIVLLLCLGAWVTYQYWGKVASEENTTVQEDAARARAALAALDPHNLPGIPDKMKPALEAALDKAQAQGAAGLREWLKSYKRFIEDPRLAWIELDFCVLVARENPGEAKKVFANVKERIGPASPVYPRLKQLEKTYE